MKSDSNDLDLLELDWENISSELKEEILKEHIQYIALSRKVIGAAGSYVANMRTLILMLLVSFILVLQGAENRTIVLTIISLQFLKTLFSRLFEANLNAAHVESQKNFIKFLKKKLLMR